jgi:hypothetical protein
VLKPEGKRPVGTSRRRWVDNIKMDLGEIWLGGQGLELFRSGKGRVDGYCEYKELKRNSVA